MPKDSYYLPSRQLVSQDDAAVIQRARVPRSKFQNRFSRLTTFDAGQLVPFLVDEILPGDHMSYDVTAYVRLQTLLFPMFSNQRVDTFFFFVPCRLCWTNWQRFMGEQPEGPNQSINFTVPQVTMPTGGFPVGNIADHFGLPTVGQVDGAGVGTVNALPFRAYLLIYNTWFRDQNVIAQPLPPITSDGPDASATYALQSRAKSHDYFTSALPWPQKFTPLQTLFTGTAPIVGIAVSPTATLAPAAGFIDSTPDATVAYANAVYDNAAEIAIKTSAAGKPQIFADLAQATGVTINALRQAWLVQDLLERDARGGTRYVELIRSHFGVTSPDFRLQRPEYIGGGQTPLNVTPVAQTTADGGGGLGALGAAGTAAGQHRASYAATEHGYVIGIVNVRTELHYQQGLHKQWTRLVRQEFYVPSLAGLGEQAILNKEIYFQGIAGDANDDKVFGYQERWHELRTRYSEVTNLFKSTSAGNIDEWHLAQHFTPSPTLSAGFLSDDPPMSRVLAAGELAAGMQYLADILINRTAVRPVPTFGTPATLARF